MSWAAHGSSSEHERNILVATLANLEIGFVVLDPVLAGGNTRTRGGLDSSEYGTTGVTTVESGDTSG